jgi:hypothetical protein
VGFHPDGVDDGVSAASIRHRADRVAELAAVLMLIEVENLYPAAYC